MVKGGDASIVNLPEVRDLSIVFKDGDEGSVVLGAVGISTWKKVESVIGPFGEEGGVCVPFESIKTTLSSLSREIPVIQKGRSRSLPINVSKLLWARSAFFSLLPSPGHSIILRKSRFRVNFEERRNSSGH